jgi:1-acyl-sn-glycerol-3-phosphate acyltransferase
MITTDRAWWYRLLQGAIRGILKLLCRFEVRGVEHVPGQGPFLLVCNHLHSLDIPVIGATFPHRSTVFAARKWERRPVAGWLLRILGDAIFVYRGEVDRRALRQALSVLQAGGILTVAPEGTRSDTGALQKGKEGIAYLALRANVALVPMVAYGQEKVISSLRRGRRASVHVVYGPPFTLPVTSGRATRAHLKELTEHIMLRLAAMLPPDYRGVYADRL